MQQPNSFGSNRIGSGVQQGNFQSFGSMPNQPNPYNSGFNSNPQYQPGSHGIVWMPPSTLEKQYYDTLFQIADEEKSGAIGGRSAVMFFTKSGLDKTILREVWTIADSRQVSHLNLGDFYVAMRLIAMAQQGQQLSLQRFQELAGSPFAIARLEGVPPIPQASPPQATYAITNDEKTKYQGIFAQHDLDHDGYIHGHEAAALFQMSGMDRSDLRTVWTLADRTGDGRLDIHEFYIAMHLIVCVTKRGLPLPPLIPPEMEQSLRGDSFSRRSSTGSFNTTPQGMSAFDNLDTSSTPTPSQRSSFIEQQALSQNGSIQGSVAGSRSGSFQGGLAGSQNGSSQGAFVGSQTASVHDGFAGGPHSLSRTSSAGIGAQATGNVGNLNAPMYPSGYHGSNMGASTIGVPPSFIGTTSQSPAVSSALSPAGSAFGSNRGGSQRGFGDFGQSPVVSAAPSPASFNKDMQGGYNAFGQSPVVSAAPSPAGSAFSSHRGSLPLGGIGDSTQMPSSAPGVSSHPATSSSTYAGGDFPQSQGLPTRSQQQSSGFGDFGALQEASSLNHQSLGDNFNGFGASIPPQQNSNFGSQSLAGAPSVTSSNLNVPVPPGPPLSSNFGSNTMGDPSKGTSYISNNAPINLGDFSSPSAHPAGFSSQSAPSSSFDVFGSPLRAPLDTVSAAVESRGFDDFPSPIPDTSLPVSQFGSNKQSVDALEDFGLPQPESSEISFGFNPSGITHIGQSSFGSNIAQQDSNSLGGISTNATSSTTDDQFGNFGVSSTATEPSNDFSYTSPSLLSPGFGEFKSATTTSGITKGFDDFPSPTNSAGFGEFSGVSSTSTNATFGSQINSNFGDLDSSSTIPSTSISTRNSFSGSSSTTANAAFGSQITSNFGDFDSSQISIAARSSNDEPQSTTSNNFGSNKPPSSGFDDFPSPTNASTIGNFPSSTPSVSSDFGDFGSSLPPSTQAFPSQNDISNDPSKTASISFLNPQTSELTTTVSDAFPSPINSNSFSNSKPDATAAFGDFGASSSQISSDSIRADFGVLETTKVTSAPAQESSGFTDFPSPISNSTPSGFSDFNVASSGFSDFPSQSTSSTASNGFGDFPSSIQPASIISAQTPDSGIAVALDDVNADLLRKMTHLSVQQKHAVQIAHIQRLIVDLLRLSAQRDQLRLNKTSDPTLTLSIKRLIDDERAFISTTTSIIQELENSSKGRSSSSLSRQPSSLAAASESFGNFEF